MLAATVMENPIPLYFQFSSERNLKGKFKFSFDYSENDPYICMLPPSGRIHHHTHTHRLPRSKGKNVYFTSAVTLVSLACNE